MTSYLQDLLIVGAAALAFLGMVAWVLLSGTGAEPDAAPLHRGEHVMSSLLTGTKFFGIISDSESPRMMRATMEMVQGEAVVTTRVIVGRPRHTSPSTIAFAQRAAAAPIFAALACELGLGRVMGVCA